MSEFLPKSTHCILCDSTRLKTAFQIYYWREKLLQFDDCETCQACFANPMPSDELISKGNSALVRYDQQGKGWEQEFREARQAYLRGKIFGKKLRQWKKRGRLLELGCAQGFFLLGVKDSTDWEVAGLEISSELQSFVQNKLGLTCYLGTLEKASLPSDYFDFVVCHDLIEHVNFPILFLEKLRTILSPHGRVQVITPNGLQDLAFARRVSETGQKMTMLLNHILYFTPKTLQTILPRFHFSPVKLYCYDIRHTPKDLGWFGMGKPKEIPLGPSMEEALKLPQESHLSLWNADKIETLRNHRKVKPFYGFFREVVPRAMTLKVPYRLGIGHEIYLLAEKK